MNQPHNENVSARQHILIKLTLLFCLCNFNNSKILGALHKTNIYILATVKCLRQISNPAKFIKSFCQILGVIVISAASFNEVCQTWIFPAKISQQFEIIVLRKTRAREKKHLYWVIFCWSYEGGKYFLTGLASCKMKQDISWAQHVKLKNIFSVTVLKLFRWSFC